MFNPYRHLLPNLYLSVAYIANPDLFACSGRTWISLNIARFYEEHSQLSSRSAWPAYPKKCNRAPIAGGGRSRYTLHRVWHITVTAPPRIGCVFGSRIDVFYLPTPMTLASGGVRCSRVWSTSQLLHPSGHQGGHSGGVCPQILG